MDREQARNYLRSSGMSEEQIAEVESAFTCDDAISRQAAIDAMSEETCGCCWDARDILAHLPSVSTEKTGRWIYNGYYECSECGKTTYNDTYKYCPNCGARMGR